VNRLYFGDNLEWLRDRREFPDASVDLVYLDPPFNPWMRITRPCFANPVWKLSIQSEGKM